MRKWPMLQTKLSTGRSERLERTRSPLSSSSHTQVQRPLKWGRLTTSRVQTRYKYGRTEGILGDNGDLKVYIFE